MAVPTLDMMASQLGDTGIMLNPDSLVTPFFDVEMYSGLDHPDFKQDQNDRAGAHGGFISALYLEPRTINIDGTIWAKTPTEIDSFLQALRQNWAPSTNDQNWYLRRPGVGIRRFLGKPLGVKYDLTNAYSRGEVPVQLQLYCGNPLEFASEFISVTGTKTSATANLDLTVVNNGNMRASGIIKIERIINNPLIQNLTTGQSIQINKSLTTSAQSFTLDLVNRLAYDQTGATIRQFFSTGSKWPEFTPGNNLIRLSGSGGVAGSFAKMTVEVWESWW